MNIGIIDETDCFSLLREFKPNIQLLQPQYFVAPNPEFFQQMLEFSESMDVIICHRKIWVDECDSDDECTRLLEFEKAIAPRSLLRVGKQATSHQSCPEELLDVYTQLNSAYNRLGSFVGALVMPPNTAWTAPYLVISALDIIGDNQVAATLKIPATGVKTKYFLLDNLQPFVLD